MHRVRIALIQMANPVTYNPDFSRPSAMVAEAAEKGAELVVLPETLPSGYFPNQNAWRLAEKRDGAIVKWACALARKFNVTIGAGFVERDASDFYNTYFLADESGVLGYVRKREAETYCYAVGDTLPVIGTGFGRVGVGICADNHMTAFMREMKSHQVDLMLMPHARATPFRMGKGVKQHDLDASRTQVEALPLLYSRVLGVPAVYVNPVGAMEEMSGLLGRFMSPDTFRFQGCSLVAAGGAILGRMGDEEGVGVFSLDLTREGQEDIPADHGGWLFPGNPLVRRVIIPLDTWRGGRSYRRNSQTFLRE